MEIKRGAENGSNRGNDLPVQYLRLLAPPLQLLSAAVWQVVQQGLVDHYGMLEEFVTMVTELVPELMSYSQKAQLIMGLRARLVLEMCRGEHPVDMQAIQPHLDRIKAPVSTAKDHHDLAQKQIQTIILPGLFLDHEHLIPYKPCSVAAIHQDPSLDDENSGESPLISIWGEYTDPQEGSFSVIKDAKVRLLSIGHFSPAWVEMKILFDRLRDSERSVDSQVSELMASQGFLRTPEQCQNRIKRLKANFRQFLEGRRGERQEFKFFDQMVQLFGNKYVINSEPVAEDADDGADPTQPL